MDCHAVSQRPSLLQRELQSVMEPPELELRKRVMYGLASCVLSATECQLPLCDSGKAALFSQARPFHGLPLTAALEVAEWEAVGKVHYQKGSGRHQICSLTLSLKK